MKVIIVLLVMFSVQGCRNNSPRITSAAVPLTVKLLPLGGIDDRWVADMCKQLKTYHARVELLPAEKLPVAAWYAPRSRYRADSIIRWLQSRAADNEVYLAITAADISTNKGTIKDFGIMGLGYCPGKACVASVYRLKNKNNFDKVALHELAHTTGLPHCPDKTCYLRDAEGGDPTAEENSFCEKCTAYLQQNGWKF